ncbi:MAG: hypothetical protein ABIC18_04440 [Candidatus Omnitrophota bacterium]
MKKISLIVFDKYREESLLALRRLGVMHVTSTSNQSCPQIDDLEKALRDTEKALSIISAYHILSKEQSSSDNKDIASCIDQIITFGNQREDCLRKKSDIEEKISWYDHWGDFSLNNLKQLREAGVYIRLYTCDKKALINLRKTRILEVINKQGNNYYIAVVSLSDKEDAPDCQEAVIPQEELVMLKIKLKGIQDKLIFLDNLLIKSAAHRSSLLSYLGYLGKSLDFNNVKSSMRQDGEISFLEGFMPAGDVGRLADLAKKNSWAYLIQDPENPNHVPTLIRNPRWLRIIDPVFKFMGTLPGYKEYDISFSFLLFFSLFFAMLIGDAGYGLIFCLVTYLVRKKLPRLPVEPFILMYVLAFFTIIWGALSGTWFGFEKIAQLPFFRGIVINRINSFIDGNQSFMIQLCFLIGVVHLTVAHATIALRIINSLRALAQLGWILIIWGLFFVAGKLVLTNALPEYTMAMLYAGCGLVLLFSCPQKNILKGILSALADLPLKLINSFSDLISYVRLFAVGYASVAVASSFNGMALRIGFDNILGGFIAALIIFLGHGLNIALGLMAVIVHGIRLNMLEFSSHLGMQWSGVEYRPFKE